jgi:mono/diheme cytochrome c family protein
MASARASFDGRGMVRAALVLAAAVAALQARAASAEREPGPSAVADQLERGARLYASGCATARCHGARGEGVRSGRAFSVWPLVGREFQARNPTAQIVFDVVRSGREESLRALGDQEIYDAIAYELSLSGARAEERLTMANAAGRLSGLAARAPLLGELHPPAGNMVPLPPARGLTEPPAPAQNGSLRLQVDQLARAKAIGRANAPGAGEFAVLVVAFQDLTDHPIALEPGRLRLETSAGARLAPRELELDYPIERFHRQTITPEHGTAAVAIFSLAPDATPARLAYDDGTGQPLSVDLRPCRSCHSRQ